MRVDVEQLRGGLRARRQPRRRGRAPSAAAAMTPGRARMDGPQSENWKRMALVVKLAFDGSGPCDGSSSFSRMKFAWILKKRLMYQFTPNVVTWSRLPRMTSARGLVEPGSPDAPLLNRRLSTRAPTSTAPNPPWKQRLLRLVDVRLLLAGNRVGAADVPAFADERRQIGVFHALAAPLGLDAHPLRLDRRGPRQELHLDAGAAARAVHDVVGRRKEVLLAAPSGRAGPECLPARRSA